MNKSIYHRIPVGRAIKALQRVTAKEELSKEIKERLEELEFYEEKGISLTPMGLLPIIPKSQKTEAILCLPQNTEQQNM